MDASSSCSRRPRTPSRYSRPPGAALPVRDHSLAGAPGLARPDSADRFGWLPSAPDRAIDRSMFDAVCLAMRTQCAHACHLHGRYYLRVSDRAYLTCDEC